MQIRSISTHNNVQLSPTTPVQWFRKCYAVYLRTVRLRRIIKSRAVAGKPRDATVNFNRYGVCRQLVFFRILLSRIRASTTMHSINRSTYVHIYVTLLTYLLHTITTDTGSHAVFSMTAMYTALPIY